MHGSDQPSGYGPPPGYGPPSSYGPPPGWGAPWGPPPVAPQRPGAAAAAAVLGFVAGGLTALMVPYFLVFELRGDGDPPTVVLLVGGVPCAAGLLAGGVQLLRRRTARLLFWSALAAVATLAVTVVAALATLAQPSARLGLVVFVVLALPLPVIAACLAGRRDVARWLGDHRR